MKWYNLRKNKCPDCNKDFMVGLKIESNMQPTLFIHKCGFKITEAKYKEIVAKMNEQNLGNTLMQYEEEEFNKIFNK